IRDLTVTGVQTCALPISFAGPTIFLMWDDLYTLGTAAGQGIFTTTTGTAPNRKFIVEWRAQDCCSTAAAAHNFEAIFSEGGTSRSEERRVGKERRSRDRT